MPSMAAHCWRRLSPLRLVIALSAVGAPAAQAQHQLAAWTTEDGLPQNVITGIHQSADGYLWIATLDGLSRFDGVSFTTFNRSNTPAIESNRFTTMYADRRGDLWLGTEVGVVTRYSGGRFSSYDASDGLLQGPVYAFIGDDAGRLWVLSAYRILRWQPEAERFTAVDAPAVAGGYRVLNWSERKGFWGVDDGVLHRFAEGRWEHLPLPSSLLANVSDVAQAQDGTLWMAARDGRLTQWDEGRIVDGGAEPTVAWRAASGEPWTLSVGRNLRRSLELSSADRTVTLAPTMLYEDREGNLWLGTDGQGLYRVRKQLVTVYSEPQGLVAANVYPIVQGADGSVWIGAGVGGLSRFQDGRFTNYTTRDGLAPGAVTALAVDADGRLWVALAHGGLQIFADGRFTDVQSQVPVTSTIRAIHQDSGGAMWFGTDDGLVRRADGRTRVFTMRDGLATDNVKVIVASPTDERLWIGGYGGLSRWQDGRVTRWTESEGLPDGAIRALYEDGDGVLWIGTYDGGLMRFHDGRFTHYTVDDGLFSHGAFQILDDRRGYLWMSSNRGIYRVSRRDLTAFAAGRRTEITSVAYGTSDGMLNAECNGGMWPAGIRAADGRLWFPTQDGVAVIDPATVTINRRPPPVVIASMLLNREPLPLPADGRPLRLPPTRSTFDIQYTGLSFVNSERIRFRYRLQGLDRGWVEAGNRRTANYSHVPPGRYTFTVIAANRDGVWNTRGASLALVVPPPFYRSGWFLTLVTAIAGGLVIAAWQRRERRLKRAHASQRAFSRQLIASQEAERKRIAGELHDGLGQRLVIIKNLAMLASGAGAVRAGERVSEIADEASQAIAEVREIGQNLRPRHLDHLGLTKVLEALARKAANASTVRFTADVDNLDGLFPKDAEITVYRVVQECVNNILKHSQATAASITARRSPSQLWIAVEDDGCGFAPAADAPSPEHGGFGLFGMRERVTQLGGTFDVRSIPGRGTTVTIHFEPSRVSGDTIT